MFYNIIQGVFLAGLGAIAFYLARIGMKKH
jgi:hypothetical protein